MSDRVSSLINYLRDLIENATALQAEKAQLLAASTRIPIINATILDVRTDAQTALDRLNILQGTSLTLADMIKNFSIPGAP